MLLAVGVCSSCSYRIITGTVLLAPHCSSHIHRRKFLRILNSISFHSYSQPVSGATELVSHRQAFHSHLQHHNSDATTFLTNIILPIHASRNRIRFIIIQIIMQLSIPSTKLLLFQKQCVIHQRQCIKHIKLILLRDDKRVVDKSIETRFKFGDIDGCGRGWDAGFGGVVEEICCADMVVFWVVYDGGLEGVEGEEVGDFLRIWVLGRNISTEMILSELWVLTSTM